MAVLEATKFKVKKMYKLGIYTENQRNNLSPRQGDIIFNSTSAKVEVYNGTDWFEF